MHSNWQSQGFRNVIPIICFVAHLHLEPGRQWGASIFGDRSLRVTAKYPLLSSASELYLQTLTIAMWSSSFFMKGNFFPYYFQLTTFENWKVKYQMTCWKPQGGINHNDEIPSWEPRNCSPCHVSSLKPRELSMKRMSTKKDQHSHRYGVLTLD